jgi:hypothetical protein
MRSWYSGGGSAFLLGENLENIACPGFLVRSRRAALHSVCITNDSWNRYTELGRGARTLARPVSPLRSGSRASDVEMCHGGFLVITAAWRLQFPRFASLGRPPAAPRKYGERGTICGEAARRAEYRAIDAEPRANARSCRAIAPAGTKQKRPASVAAPAAPRVELSPHRAAAPALDPGPADRFGKFDFCPAHATRQQEKKR